MSAFESDAPAGFFARPEMALGSRLQAARRGAVDQRAAEPGAGRPLRHTSARRPEGDERVPARSAGRGRQSTQLRDGGGGGRGAKLLIDFASTGVGFGMADVALHLVHALMPADLEGVGEEALVNSYTLTRSPLPAARPHRPTLESRPCDTSAWLSVRC